DADLAAVALDGDPLVVLRVAVALGVHAASLARALVERGGHDARLHATAADLHLELGPHPRARRGQVRAAQALLQEGSEAAGRDVAGRLLAEEDRVAMARDAALGRLEADEPARRALRLLLEEHLPAVPVALGLVERQRPAEPGLDERRGLVHVVA